MSVRMMMQGRKPAAGGITDPTDIAGLAIWLDASAITGLVDTDPVSSWSDGSGNTRTFSQATAINQPTYRTNILNGLPVVRFGGADDYLTAAAGASYTQPTTMFVVHNSNTTGSYRQLFHSGQELFWQDTNVLNVWAGAFGVGISSPSATHRTAVAQLNGASSKLWMSGGAGTTGDPGTAATGTGVLSLCRHPTQGRYLNGDIAEFILYDAALSLSEIDDVGTYLASKWGVAWSTPT